MKSPSSRSQFIEALVDLIGITLEGVVLKHLLTITYFAINVKKFLTAM